MAVALSELDNISSLKEEQRTALRFFPSIKVGLIYQLAPLTAKNHVLM